MDFKITLGSRIKELRNNINISQIEFCKLLNMSITRESLSNIEKGKQNPSAEFIKSVIEAFNVSPYWLLDIKKESIDDRLDRIDLLDEEGRIALFNYIDFLLEVNRKTNP